MTTQTTHPTTTERKAIPSVSPSQPQQASSTMRILVIDDDPGDCELISRGFQRPGREPVRIVTAHTVEKGCEFLENQRFDCVILDHRLPDGFGYEVLERMDEQLLTTPIISLATEPDPQVALTNLRNGAVEFLDKKEIQDSDNWRSRVFEAISRFKRRCTAIAIEQARDRSGVDSSQEELVAAARIDPLLDILNRGAITDCHYDLHKRMTGEKTSYAVCMVDIDFFKKFNDRFGHIEGDNVLQRVASVLRNSLRANDFIGRYGGEEILILLENIKLKDASLVTSRLANSIQDLAISHPDNAPHGCVTISMGTAVFDPTNPVAVDDLVNTADELMYKSKHSGRNQSLVAGLD